MSLTNALRIATVAHYDIVDKGGFPFIGHPLRVMAELARQGFDEQILEAAILHDVVEDTEWTLDDLHDAGIHLRAVNLVDLMTRQEGSTYAEYIQRIKHSEGYAVDIKIADIYDNLHPSRATSGSDKLRDRYLKALAILESD